MHKKTKKIIIDLKKEFDNKNISARKLGKEINVSHTTISRMFKFEHIPSIDIIIKISEYLKVYILK